MMAKLSLVEIIAIVITFIFLVALICLYLNILMNFSFLFYLFIFILSNIGYFISPVLMITYFIFILQDFKGAYTCPLAKFS